MNIGLLILSVAWLFAIAGPRVKQWIVTPDDGEVSGAAFLIVLGFGLAHVLGLVFLGRGTWLLLTLYGSKDLQWHDTVRSLFGICAIAALVWYLGFFFGG